MVIVCLLKFPVVDIILCLHIYSNELFCFDLRLLDWCACGLVVGLVPVF